MKRKPFKFRVVSTEGLTPGCIIVLGSPPKNRWNVVNKQPIGNPVVTYRLTLINTSTKHRRSMISDPDERFWTPYGV